MTRSETTGAEQLLVVDDDPSVRAALTRALGRVGYRVTAVASAEEALPVVASGDVDCAVVDLRMPGMGGYAFMRRCRESWPSMAIVVLTGHGDKQDVIECLRLGAADFLSKPWSESELRSAILRALESRRLRQAAAPREPPAPAAAPGVAAVSAIIDRMRSGEIPPPRIPEVGIEARQLAGSGQASAARMREVVERHPALTDRILRLANSACFAGYGPVTELQPAIARIGFRELSNLIDTLMTRRLHAIQASDADAVAALHRVWRHALARAAAARFLAQDRPEAGVGADQAYLAGLFCDVGAAFLAQSLLEGLPGAAWIDIAVTVADHHAAMSDRCARICELPVECVEACRDHHLMGPVEQASPLLRILWAAEAACVELGMEGDPQPVPCHEETSRLFKMARGGTSALVAKTRSYLDQIGPIVEAVLDETALD